MKLALSLIASLAVGAGIGAGVTYQTTIQAKCDAPVTSHQAFSPGFLSPTHLPTMVGKGY